MNRVACIGEQQKASSDRLARDGLARIGAFSGRMQRGGASRRPELAVDVTCSGERERGGAAFVARWRDSVARTAGTV